MQKKTGFKYLIFVRNIFRNEKTISFQLNMVIFFVVIWKHVWRIIVYKVKEKKTRGGIQKKIKIILNHKEEYRNH